MIRTLSVDTPEVHYPGTTKPSAHDKALAQLGKELRMGKHPKLPSSLAKYLAWRLDGAAGTRQLTQGERSTVDYDRILEERTKSKSGRGRRGLFTRTSSEMFEQHGRLLAYVAPAYVAAERVAMSAYERRTFNFQRVEEGWAAPFILYPSLPKPEDLAMFRAAAAEARTKKRGHYAEPLTLTGYELRFCIELIRKDAELPERSCADMSTGRLYGPAEYLAVKEEDRMFVWPRAKATKAAGLVRA